MVKEHIPSVDELLEALGLAPMSQISLTLRKFKIGRPLTDLKGNPIAMYARKRPLKTIAEELGISIHKLKRMLRVVKKDGIDGL
jgi:hypothetical protein